MKSVLGASVAFLVLMVGAVVGSVSTAAADVTYAPAVVEVSPSPVVGVATSISGNSGMPGSLQISVSTDGRHWTNLGTVATSPSGEFSLPWTPLVAGETVITAGDSNDLSVIATTTVNVAPGTPKASPDAQPQSKTASSGVSDEAVSPWLLGLVGAAALLLLGGVIVLVRGRAKSSSELSQD